MDYINDFIKEIKSRYGEVLNIGYEFDEASDTHQVWHDNKKMETEEFSEVVGQLIDEYIFNNNIFNFAFDYDYTKVQPEFNLNTQVPLVNFSMVFNEINCLICSNMMGEAA